uniref:Oplophorus-luciferin 2-monooxygenase non-catalytic subunit-like n=1 Tax=Hirondellea gigas TaxID=1518452 RepID=A0A2P2I4L3_9CRUS
MKATAIASSLLLLSLPLVTAIRFTWIPEQNDSTAIYRFTSPVHVLNSPVPTLLYPKKETEEYHEEDQTVQVSDSSVINKKTSGKDEAEREHDNDPSLQEAEIVDLDFPCPSPGDIAPCVCNNDEEKHLKLDCTQIEGETQLARVFQNNFPVKDFYEFKMEENSGIKTLGNIFNGLTFERVIFSPGPFSIERISDFFLSDSFNTLKELQVRHTMVTADFFPFYTLSSYVNLESLYIDYTNLKWIPKITGPKIKTLSLESTGLTSLQPGTFEQLSNLKNIALSLNNFTELRNGTLLIPNTEMKFHMVNNLLEEIQPGTFYFLDDASSSSSFKVTYELSGNRLQQLHARTFPLRNAPVFLDFSNNNINNIEQGAFVMPHQTDTFSIEINLTGNQLETIEEEVFGELFRHLTALYISGNPLRCGCDMAWLITNKENLHRLDDAASCVDGTRLIDLDHQLYEHFCS